MLFAAANLNAQTPTPSSDGSKLVTVKQETLDLANKALDELELQDKVITAQDKLITALNDRLSTEKEKSALALELAEARKREAEAQRIAAGSAVEAIAAKDKIIANKDEQIEILKKKKPSILKRIGDVMLGVAAASLIRSL